MRALIAVITCVLYSQMGMSQIHEIGGFIGGSNFIGDVGSTRYINPNQLAIGGMYKWNRSPRHSYRLALNVTELAADDANSDDPRRIERGYSFQKTYAEASIGMEYTFFEFDLHDSDWAGTPYIYAGFSMGYHKNFYFNQGTHQKINEDTESWAYGIPMGLGYKMTLTRRLILGAEIVARYTFTDELDGSVPDTKDARENHSFGNTNNNDWYVFSGLTLTFTFGRNPCYCTYD